MLATAALMYMCFQRCLYYKYSKFHVVAFCGSEYSGRDMRHFCNNGVIKCHLKKIRKKLQNN